MQLLGWVTLHVTHHHMGVFRKKFVVGIFGVWIFGLLQSYPLNRISSPRLKRNVLFEEIRTVQPEVRLFLPCCFSLYVIAPLDLAHRNSFASGLLGVSPQNSDRMFFILKCILNVKCISRDYFVGHSQAFA